MKSENFKNGKLCYNRKKTRGRRDDEAYIEIVVPPVIMPLFDKYRGKKALFSFSETYANQKPIQTNWSISRLILLGIHGLLLHRINAMPPLN